MTILCCALLWLATGQAAQPVHITGSIPGPKRVKDAKPDYPDEARRLGIGGPVILEASVDAEGKVTDARVLRGLPLLNEAAVAAVRKWRYQPLLLADSQAGDTDEGRAGKPTPFILTVTVTFSPGKAPSLEDLLGTLKKKNEDLREYGALYFAEKAYRYREPERRRIAGALQDAMAKEESERVKTAMLRALERLGQLKTGEERQP
jgi:TonB family protein